MTRYAYDPHTFRLARMRSERFTSSNATTYVPAAGTLQDCTYAYDLAGNILSITDRAPAAGIPDNPDAALADDPALAQLLAAGDALVRQFSYDPIYRLRSATGRECDQPVGNPPWLDEPRCVDLTRTRAYTEQYSYDSAGSMLSLAHQNATGGFVRTFEVGIDSNRLRALRLDATTSLEYQHDGNGNTLAESSSRHFDWNYADQLKAFATQTIGAEPSVHAQYLYDAAGQRVKKLVRKQGGRVEVTHYIDGTFEHHRWATGENNHIHVTDAARRIALVRVGPAQSDDTSPAVRFELGDHLGSSSVVVDAAGSLFNREEFTPYGDTSFGSYAKKRYRFTGMERDEESALSHHGLRYYSPWLSRWINCDPAGPVDGHNLFSYAVNSPVANVDASGTQAVKIAPPAPAPPPQNTLLTGTPANDNIPSSQPATTAAREALPASTPELVRSTAAYLSAVLPAVAMGMETWLYTQRTGSIVDFGNPLGVPREDMGFAILRQTRPIQFGQPPLAPIPVAPPIPDSPPSPRTTPDQRRSKPLERVNLDTSTIVAATSLRSPFLVIGLNIFLLDKEKVATQAALTEFVDVSWKHAGPIEKLAAAMFLLGVREIPNDPAPEVMNIKITSKTSQKRLGRIDKIIFGTGHKLGIRTITGDGRFARSAASRGVHIKIYEHPPGRYRGI
jgi:RHS repeat-associated protein